MFQKTPVFHAGGFTFEDQMFKGLALGAPYTKLIGMARSPIAACMVGKTIGKRIDENQVPVYVERFGNSKEAIKGFIMSRPKDGIPGRRSMPQFNFSDEELDALAKFLKYTSEINTAGWPPNIQG